MRIEKEKYPSFLPWKASRVDSISQMTFFTATKMPDTKLSFYEKTRSFFPVDWSLVSQVQPDCAAKPKAEIKTQLYLKTKLRNVFLPLRSNVPYRKFLLKLLVNLARNKWLFPFAQRSDDNLISEERPNSVHYVNNKILCNSESPGKTLESTVRHTIVFHFSRSSDKQLKGFKLLGTNSTPKICKKFNRFRWSSR